MSLRDHDNELALREFIAQATEWAEPATEIEPEAPEEHPLETLLRWWGNMRFPDPESPEVPQQERRHG